MSEKKWVLAVQLPGVNRPWEAVRRCAGLEGVRLYAAARGRDRGRIDDVAFNPFLLQHAVNPEAVQ
ncbi:MAG TPA: hypothetical protein VNY53_13705, partial [Bradyrhizobium sp.]|nr:hypothetical protein [Bradyrhizobium sp.]